MELQGRTVFFVVACASLDPIQRKILQQSIANNNKCQQATKYYYNYTNIINMPPANANETYCTFTLASDVTAGGLPSEDEIAKDLESNDTAVSTENA